MEPAAQPKPPAFLIRDALMTDIPAICETMPDAFGLAGGAVWQDPDFVAQGLKVCAANLSGRSKIKVALNGHKLVGCSYSRLALAPDGQSPHPEVGVIHGIAVRPEHRGQGAARALLQTCEQDMSREGARVMVAEVRPRSTGFFASCGYRDARGPALLIPTAAGTYVHSQSVYSTVLMWKNHHPMDQVEAVAAKRGTVLSGVGGRTLPA